MVVQLTPIMSLGPEGLPPLISTEPPEIPAFIAEAAAPPSVPEHVVRVLCLPVKGDVFYLTSIPIRVNGRLKFNKHWARPNNMIYRDQIHLVNQPLPEMNGVWHFFRTADNNLPENPHWKNVHGDILVVKGADDGGSDHGKFTDVPENWRECTELMVMLAEGKLGGMGLLKSGSGN